MAMLVGFRPQMLKLHSMEYSCNRGGEEIREANKEESNWGARKVCGKRI
jgi:hypothetical protein